ALRPLGVGKFGLQLPAPGVAKQATGGRTEGHRPGGIEDRVADRKYDRGIERPQPPARQGRVQLLDAIPLVSGRFGAGGVVDLLVRLLRSLPRGSSSIRGSRDASKA